ncbi:MAG: FtsX-like permease family protein [Prevotella sp.]|nr:FtsX-like permease family protein [Prevotella sp.]
MNFPLFIARRIYADEGGRRQVSRPAIRIATTGVAIGLAVMIVSVCVVMGFKHTIRDKITGFGSHFVVADFMTLQGNMQQPISMNDSMVKRLKGIDGISHVQRYAYKQGVLKTDNDFMGVMLKGVGADFDATFLKDNLIEGIIPTFSDTKSSNRLAISKIMANRLKLKVGDKIFAYFVNGDDIRTRRFTIAAIYQTNMKRLDEAICFTDIYTTIRLNGWENDQVSGAEITLSDLSKEQAVEQQLIDRIDRTSDPYGATYSSISIKKLYPQIFAWIELLDINVWIILALMMAVAGITMISGLLIIILERTNMIGVMKALGARNKTIRHTFLWFAVFIIGKGLLIGNILALTLCLIQKCTSIVKLDPANYYVSEVPLEINPLWILFLNAGTLIISVIVLIAPGYLVSHIHPAKSIRFE